MARECLAVKRFAGEFLEQIPRLNLEVRSVMSPNEKWIVTTSGDRPLVEVARELGDVGFAVEQVLETIGCITGDASEEVADRARSLPGVADISRSTRVDIGPPGSLDTW